MGFYSEYLDQQLSFEALTNERKNLLKKISEIRGRDILVFAADLTKQTPLIAINYSDLLPINDQLANLSGKSVDILLETPGGSGEIAEDIVRLLHTKYQEVGVIIPGWAKSAGTIIAMAGDEILMEPASALGPIDAQLTWQGKSFSADALIEGFEKIKEQVNESGTLNRAYIPILQGISPGELQSADNALKFARVLVTDWLARYKFAKWTTHSSTGLPVTDEDRKARAEDIAKTLCDHRKWLTHGRSIKIDDLKAMRLQITDYSTNPDLFDAIRRYHTLLQMTFATNVYKVFETPTSQIYKFMAQQVQQPQSPANMTSPDKAIFDVTCAQCQTKYIVQANLDKKFPLEDGKTAFPTNNKLVCGKCGAVTDLSDAKRQIEIQTKKTVIS